MLLNNKKNIQEFIKIFEKYKKALFELYKSGLNKNIIVRDFLDFDITFIKKYDK